MTHIMMTFLILILIPFFIFMIFIPYWTRKTESFGVSIPKEIYYTPKLKMMRNKYAKMMTFVSIVALLLLLFIYFFISKDEWVISITYSVIIVSYLLISFVIYLAFHRQMKQQKAEENWTRRKSQQIVIHTEFHKQKLTVSHWLYILPIIISFLTVLFTLLFYDRIPEQIPMHYNFSGEVTKLATKSYGNVLLLPFTQLFLIVMMLLINFVIAKSKQQVSAENPEKSMKRNVIFRRRWSIFTYITTIMLTLMFALLQTNMFFEIHQTVMMVLPLLITLIVIIGAVILSITTGQGGSRITFQTEKDDKVIDRDDDQYWKLGQFYFNKEDPTLFLEKRFGIGWTINWARPTAWLLLLMIILLAAGIPLLLS